jgi:hypothetical protein
MLPKPFMPRSFCKAPIVEFLRRRSCWPQRHPFLREDFDSIDLHDLLNADTVPAEMVFNVAAPFGRGGEPIVRHGPAEPDL